jgi:hypothetical protein
MGLKLGIDLRSRSHAGGPRRTRKTRSHPVHPGCGPRVQSPVGRAQAIQVDVMQERCELRVPSLLCDSAHTIQRTWRALSGPVSGTRFAGRVPLGQPPSLHRLRRHGRGVVRRLHR